MTSIYSWSLTAANNATADSGINWAEGQAPSTANDSARVMMERGAEWLADMGFTLTAGGTASAITLTANSAFTTLATGRMVTFKAASASTGATTLNVNAIGAKKLLKLVAAGESELAANDIVANGRYMAFYDSTADGGTGAWFLMDGHEYMPRAGGTLTGALLHASGSESAPSIGFSADPNTGAFHDGTADAISLTSGGTKFGMFGLYSGTILGQLLTRAGGGILASEIKGEGTTFIGVQRSSANNSGGLIGINKSRGTIASPASASQNDILGEFTFGSWTTGSTFASVASMRGDVVAASPSATDQESRIVFNAAAAGSIARTEVARLHHATGFSMYGANPVIDSNRLLVVRSYTYATLPSASGTVRLAWTTDEGLVISNGTSWLGIEASVVIP